MELAQIGRGAVEGRTIRTILLWIQCYTRIYPEGGCGLCPPVLPVDT